MVPVYIHSKRLCQPPTAKDDFSVCYSLAPFRQRYSLAPFVSAIRRKKKAKAANGYAVQVGWSLKNVQVKKIKHHSFGNCLYHLFLVIREMVYYCFAHMIQQWKMMMTHTKSGPPFFETNPSKQNTQLSNQSCAASRRPKHGPACNRGTYAKVIGDHHSKLSIVENRKYRGFPSHGGTPKSMDFPL